MGEGVAALEVGVLGPLVATLDGRPLDLGPYRQRAVLAMLAVHAGTVVSADRLVDEVWSGDPPPSALGTLQAYVSNLRRALEPDRPARMPARVIATEPPGYVLRVDAGRLDALRFERALAEARAAGGPDEALALVEEALGLWRGPPLAEFEHEDFTTAWRARLEELRAGAVELRIGRLLDLDRAADAVAELAIAVERWPLREHLRAQQVVALARAGRQAEALRAYEAARRHLRDELGLSPGPELEGAHRRVLDGLEPGGRPRRMDAVDAVGSARGPEPGATVPRSRAAGGRLPVALTSFVGRRGELAQLAGELARHRVVTLVGPGGIGKTRLAVEAARQATSTFEDGVVLCELAPVTAGDDVAFALGSVLDVRPQDELTMAEAVIESLHDRHVLLVVDNCEHVLDAAAGLVARIVARCPAVTVLATSREPLAVQGERACLVRGLDLAVDAPTLFWDRARAAGDILASTGVDPATRAGAVGERATDRWATDDQATSDQATSDQATDQRATSERAADDAANVAAICARLDGLPLAIELAAARARSMTLGDIAVRLDDRFHLLRGPARDRPERHQTLLAAVDWSYQLLAAPERDVFDRLSIFPGSFDAAATAAVCAPDEPDHVPVVTGASGRPVEIDTADLLHQLVDKSVVVAERTGPTTRFLLLETLRQHGSSHLEAAEREGLERRFVRHYLDVAGQARDRLVDTEAAAGRAAFRREWHNLRAAMQYAVAAGDVASVIGLLDAVHWHAEAAGLVEVGAWAESALGQVGKHPALFGAAGFYASMRGDNEQARHFAEAGLAAGSSPDDPDTRLCWQTLQLVHWYGGRPAAALEAQLRAAALAVAVGDRYGAVFAYASAGSIATLAGRDDGADLLREAARVGATLASPAVQMWVKVMTGTHQLAEGRLEEAFATLGEAAERAAACEAVVWETRALAVRARAAARLGHPDAIAICRDLLARLYATRSWSDVYGLLQTVLEVWSDHGRLREAATLLGFLDAHELHHVLAAAGRARAASRVMAHPAAVSSVATGAGMDRDDLAAWVLDRLAVRAR